MKPLKLAGIGCGGRTRTYLGLAAEHPHLFEIVAAADPNPSRLELTKKLSRNPNFRSFVDDKALFAEPRLADILVIGTQDSYHVAPCLAAMEKGYNILLEKPISPNPEEILMLERRAWELGRRVLVCHVLRYTPFYQKVKEIIDAGLLGDVVTIHATEGVDPWHQAHSYVRGHWAVREKASPMILAKSCHDLDILSWFMDAPCHSVASFGSLQHFTPNNRPLGAPERCTDACPVAESCPYNALRYTREHRPWLEWIMDGGISASSETVIDWLKTSPWGRCVYACDNTVVDRQVLALDFGSGKTATFTMTAFDSGRNLEIMGTRACLRGGDFLHRELGCDLLLREHDGGGVQKFNLPVPQGGYDGHAGGDVGLVSQLHHEMTHGEAEDMKSSLTKSLESHLMAFAAEESRITGKTISLGTSLP